MDWPKVLGSKGQKRFCEVILYLFHLWRTTQSVSTHNIVDRSRNFDYNIIFVPSLSYALVTIWHIADLHYSRLLFSIREAPISTPIQSPPPHLFVVIIEPLKKKKKKTLLPHICLWDINLWYKISIILQFTFHLLYRIMYHEKTVWWYTDHPSNFRGLQCLRLLH